jgi:hypothetical protein
MRLRLALVVAVIAAAGLLVIPSVAAVAIR